MSVNDKHPADAIAQEYQITHPSAQVNGIIKGAYYGTISDQISVTCRGGDGKVKLRTLLDYKDEVGPRGESARFRDHLRICPHPGLASPTKDNTVALLPMPSRWPSR
jgi:hypothetical protein